MDKKLIEHYLLLREPYLTEAMMSHASLIIRNEICLLCEEFEASLRREMVDIPDVFQKAFE